MNKFQRFKLHPQTGQSPLQVTLHIVFIGGI